jgi:dienelactone hydrolase
MYHETLEYSSAGTTFKGYLAYDDSIQGKRPGIVIAHAWKGLDSFAKQKAIELAKLGYIALAADVYGNGQEAKDKAQAVELLTPLFKDRKLLQERIRAGFDTLQKHPLTDRANMGGIGFCFGGLTIIELFRSGAPLQGVVSFHGLLGKTMGTMTATTVPLAKDIKGSILILHGHEDPLVSEEDIESFQNEMTDHHIDWEMVIYGNTLHAFTNPEANDTSMGLIYNQLAEKRSWQAMRNFFEERFKTKE